MAAGLLFTMVFFVSALLSNNGLLPWEWTLTRPVLFIDHHVLRSRV
jgi:hypothetical protein